MFMMMLQKDADDDELYDDSVDGKFDGGVKQC